MLTKNMTVSEMDDAGKGLAIIADLTDVDHDGDTYEAGAFNWKDQWCPLLTAHDRRDMPFGKARVYEEDEKAYAELHLNLETQSGREWHSALKFDLAKGRSVQEWSYGYSVLDADYAIRGDSKVRRLKRVDVHEVSAVVRGAGRGTRTIDVKAIKAAMKDGEFDALIGQLGEMESVLAGDPALLSATGRKQLEQIHASLGKALAAPKASDGEDEAKARAAIEAEMVRLETRDLRLRGILS